MKEGAKEPAHLVEWEQVLDKELNGAGQESSWLIRCYEDIASTMDLARSLTSEVSIHRPGLVLARWQSGGRGRQGRAWLSAEGALLATLIFATSRPVADLSAYPLVAGCVLAEFFRGLSCSVGLKWPNDVLSEDGRKLSGLLLESMAAEEMNFVLVGIGVNLTAVPAETAAVSLQELCGQVLSPTRIMAPLAQQLYYEWTRFVEDGFMPYRGRWLALAHYLGQEVAYDCGREVLRGKVMGINEAGALLILDRESNVREIVAGHMLD